MLAIISILVWPCLTGLLFTQTYNSVLFDKLIFEGWTFKMCYIDGVIVLSAGTILFIVVDKVKRRKIIIYGFIVQIIIMYLTTAAFYVRNIY